MALKDKAKRIDFTFLPAAENTFKTGEIKGEAKPPKTAPGVMMAFAVDQRSDLLLENDALKTQASRVGELEGRLSEATKELQGWEGAKATRLIEPAHIQRSQYANRHEINFSGLEFEKLKVEISNAGGNVQPIKVRPIASSDDKYRYEIVFGHRRHEACRQLGLKVSAIVDNLDDQTLFVEMERENRERKDLSGWEQGVMYKNALDMGLFPSSRKLAEAVGVDLGNLGKALSLARLPAEVVGAFHSPLDLQFRWAKPLTQAYENDCDAFIGRAKRVNASKHKLSSKEIFEILVGAAQGVVPYNPPADIVVKHERKLAAVLSVDAKGRTVVCLEAVIDDRKRQDLARLVQHFIEAQ